MKSKILHKESSTENDQFGENHIMFRQAEKVAKIGSWKLNISSGEISWSNGMYKLFEVRQSANQNLRQIGIDHIHPNDKSWVIQKLDLAIGNLKSSEIEYRIILHDGSEKTLFCRCEPVKNPEHDIQYYFGTTQDITKQKNTERLLRTSDNRFKQVAEAANEWIWEVDQNGLFTYSSSVVKTLLGYEPEEIVGKKHFYDFFIPEERENKKQQALDYFKKRKNFVKFENSNLHKNGSVVIHETSGSPIIDEKGELKGFRGVDVDVTERKRQEVKLEESSMFSNSLLHTIPLGVDIVSKEGEILFANNQIQDLFNRNIIGEKCWDTYRDNKEQCELCPLKENFNLGETKAIVSKGVLGGRIVEISHSKLVYNGQNAIMEVFYDITDRIRSDGIQRVVYKIANAINSTIDLDDLLPAIKEILGEIIDTTNFFIALYNREKSIITVPYIVDEKDNFESIPIDNSLTGYVIRTKKPLLYKDGKNLLSTEKKKKLRLIGTEPLVWLGVPLEYQNEIIGAIAVQSYNDPNAFSETDLELLEYVSKQIGITIQRKRTEVELISALKKAKESDRLKLAFISNISHEFRTPLNSILGFSDLLSETDRTKEDMQSYIEMINAGGTRLMSIVDDIVNISLVDSGQLTKYLSEFDVGTFLESIYRSFVKLKEPSSVKINLDKCPEIIVNSDKQKVKHVLDVLLDNAFKNTNDGNISFGFVIVDSSIRFHVKDTGTGISPDYQDKVFERFFRIENSSKLNSGTGLGLAISKAIVKILGGDIWFESELGVGSTFYFTIPLG